MCNIDLSEEDTFSNCVFQVGAREYSLQALLRGARRHARACQGKDDMPAFANVKTTCSRYMPTISTQR